MQQWSQNWDGFNERAREPSQAAEVQQSRIAYLEQVLTNLWIYRNRLGQTSPSLAALAEGDWPSYETIDGNVGSDNAAIASRR